MQLGDSVASGEGTLYGYRYNSKRGRWTGGNLNVRWPGRYPLCHDSPYAYGQVVARALRARLFQFACSGASYKAGIVATQTLSSGAKRPAQFGPGPYVQPPLYRQANPNIVLVTLGANDIGLIPVATYCVLHKSEGECTNRRPGPAVRSLVRKLPGAAAGLKRLANWIALRGAVNGAGKLPSVVFTDYFDPFPPRGRTCPDEFYSAAQSRFLHELQRRFNGVIRGAILSAHRRHATVRFVELGNAFAGHTWCTRNPWVYGVSIGISSLGRSPAPFHPTPAGQKRIARLVLRALGKAPHAA